MTTTSGKTTSSTLGGFSFKRKIKNEENWAQLKERCTGGNNYQCNNIIHTPWGKFETYLSAVNEAKRLRSEEDRKDVVTDRNTLRKYCESCIVLNRAGRRTYPEWRGKSTKQLGFYTEEKNGKI